MKDPKSAISHHKQGSSSIFLGWRVFDCDAPQVARAAHPGGGLVEARLCVLAYHAARHELLLRREWDRHCWSRSKLWDLGGEIMTRFSICLAHVSG